MFFSGVDEFYVADNAISVNLDSTIRTGNGTAGADGIGRLCWKVALAVLLARDSDDIMWADKAHNPCNALRLLIFYLPFEHP